MRASMKFSTSGTKDLIRWQLSSGTSKPLKNLIKAAFLGYIRLWMDNRFASRTFNAGKLAFKQTAAGLAVVLPGSQRAIVHVVPDPTYPTMWRVRFPDKRLSAMAIQPWAKDAALLHAAAILDHQRQGAQPLAAA